MKTMKNYFKTLAFFAAFLTFAIFPVQAGNYSYTFTEQQWEGNGSATLGQIEWTIDAPGAGYWGMDQSQYDKGQQIGSAKLPATSITLSTSEIKGTITSIKVTTAGASQVVADLAVSVGETKFKSSGSEVVPISMEVAEYDFTGSKSGEIVITWTNNSAKALYLKAIEVTYSEGSEPEEPEPPTVSIEETVKASALSVYPNPANGAFNVKVAAPSIVTIYNAAGVKVNSMNVSENAEVNSLNNGIYILRAVDANGKVSTERIIVR